MITETYVSFEVAKLLKEEGFECEKKSVTAMYNEIGEFHSLSTAADEYYDYSDFDEYDYIAPTLQMAMDWLRVTYKHHIVAEPRLYNSANTDSDFSRWLWTIITEDSYLYSEGEDFPTYESAAEAALKHCLENLI